MVVDAWRGLQYKLVLALFLCARSLREKIDKLEKEKRVVSDQRYGCKVCNE